MTDKNKKASTTAGLGRNKGHPNFVSDYAAKV